MTWSEAGRSYGRASQAPPGMSLLPAKPVERDGKRCMKPETVRIPVMTSPGAACVPMFVGAVASSWDGCHRVRRTSHGVRNSNFCRCVQSVDRRSQRQQPLLFGSRHGHPASLDGCHQNYNARVRDSGFTHLSGSGCAGARGENDLPTTRVYAQAVVRRTRLGDLVIWRLPGNTRGRLFTCIRACCNLNDNTGAGTSVG